MEEAGYDSDDGGDNAAHHRALTTDPKYQLNLAPPRRERPRRRRQDEVFNMPIQAAPRRRTRPDSYA